ncbi:hypothetical protein MNBD_PLANCTO02-1744 [hydrothermal vent metagenome]|uniref:Endonuclease/exonuclease/phosphatase domain-containing protein n=1 Tax=hydrothermal vent metagenome TaxID=652676 RepID=A0A3B1DY39_9ZZZZ
MTVGLVAVTLLSMLGQTWWVFDLFCHFRVQYSIFLAFLLIAFMRCRSGRWVGITLFTLALNLSPVAMSYFPLRSPASDDASSLKVISLNVYSGNSQYQKVIDSIHHEDPDLFFLFEFTPRWEKQLQILEKKYPYSFNNAQQGNFGTACFSKRPFEEAALKELSKNNQSLFVEIEYEGRTVCLVGAHPYPPGGSSFSKVRNQQMRQLENHLAEKLIPTIVVGDLNNTPWSSHFQDFLSNTNLIDSRFGFGNQATWPSYSPSLLRIPIDHCLLSREFVVTNRQVGPQIGSDHLPVIISVVWK